MFRFTQEPSSGSYDQCLAKITSLVQMCVVSTDVISVMAAYCDLVCVYTVQRSTSLHSEPYTRTPGHNMLP